MNCTLLEKNKYLNTNNNNLLDLNNGLNIDKNINITNIPNDMKLFNVPLPNTIEFQPQTLENNNNKIKDNKKEIKNYFNIKYINGNNNNQIENIINNSVPNIPKFFNDNKEIIYKNKTQNNQIKLNEFNILNPIKEINNINNIFNTKDTLILNNNINNNNNILNNNLSNIFNRILSPGFNKNFNLKNNFLTPPNLFPYFSNPPLNQGINKVINRNINEMRNFINNNSLKRNDIQ